MEALRQYIPMSEGEAWCFLENHRVMSLATVGKDGVPHNTPVWYVVRGRKLYFRAHSHKVKVKNILAGSRISLTVYDGSKYTELRGVTVTGRAAIVNDEGLAEELNRLLLEKYSYERNYHEMPEHWRRYVHKLKRVVVEITPERTSSWDNSKWVSKCGENT